MDLEPIEVADSTELVEPTVVASYAKLDQPAEEDQPTTKAQVTDHQLPPQFQNISAKGGAVAAIVLGCLAIFGAFLTQWSLFNALVGLLLGLWGLKSNLHRTSMIGICFCLIGLALCFVLYAK